MKKAGIGSAIILAIVPWVAQAQTLIDPLGGKSFQQVVASVSSFLFWDVASPLATIMVLVGAFQLITSSGDPEKTTRGRKTILYAAIGLAASLLAGGIANIVLSLLGGSTS